MKKNLKIGALRNMAEVSRSIRVDDAGCSKGVTLIPHVHRQLPIFVYARNRRRKTERETARDRGRRRRAGGPFLNFTGSPGSPRDGTGKVKNAKK